MLKGFSFTKKKCIQQGSRLSAMLYVMERIDECVSLCEFLVQPGFIGDFRLWSFYENCHATLFDQKPNDSLLEIIITAGFQKNRLNGALLQANIKNFDISLSEDRKVGIIDYGISSLQEHLVIKAASVKLQEAAQLQENKINDIKSFFRIH